MTTRQGVGGEVKYVIIIAAYLAAAGCGAGVGGGWDGATIPPPSRADDGTSRSIPATAGGQAAAISYRPVGNTAFVLHRRDSLILHLPGGALQNQSVERTLYLHLSLTAGVAPNRYGAMIVLDSLRMTASALPVSPDSLRALQGLRWTATVDPSGRLADLRANRPTTLGDQLTSHLRLLFPILPPGGARAGITWADSIQFPVKADAFDATEQVRTSYRAAEDSLGIRIQSQSAYRRTGKGVQFDQQLEMTAAGARRETHLLGREGVLLAAEGTDSGTMTISVPAKGQTVPVDRASRYEVRAIR